jgi:YD repeat-containing protein
VGERIAAVVEYNQGSPITTSYDYDPLGQITLVKDDHGNRTTVEYDQMGRRTAIVNPDTGRTAYSYDAGGNLTSKLSANYQVGKEIRYNYHFNRLIGINYPDSTDVLYEYGPMNGAYNRAGRIAKVTDESGVEERFYGKLGETVKEVKTVNAKTPAAQRKSYTTDYVFDSFGRSIDRDTLALLL